MDAMLGEVWRSIQAETGRDGLRKGSKLNRLGDLVRALQKRKRESSGYWESV